MTIASTGGTVTLGLYDTQSQLKEKASITYVDNKVDPLQAGHKGYATLAQAQAAQSGLAANTVVEVLSDTTEVNNGYYLWNGTTLTKTTFSPLVQANNYTDSKVATSKAEAIATAASDATTKANNAVTTANNYTDSVFADVPVTLEPYVTQAEAAATAANIAGKVYATPSEGVAPVTGVPSGQYFNVRSSSNDNYIDEYLNNAGVAQATGKSYPSSAYVQDIENYVAKPFVTGKTYALNSHVQLENGDIVRSTIPSNVNNPNENMTGWVNLSNPNGYLIVKGVKRPNFGFVCVEWFGAKTEQDCTTAVNAAIAYVKASPIRPHSASRGGLLGIYFGGGVFRLTSSIAISTVNGLRLIGSGRQTTTIVFESNTGVLFPTTAYLNIGVSEMTIACGVYNQSTKYVDSYATFGSTCWDFDGTNGGSKFYENNVSYNGWDRIYKTTKTTINCDMHELTNPQYQNSNVVWENSNANAVSWSFINPYTYGIREAVFLNPANTTRVDGGDHINPAPFFKVTVGSHGSSCKFNGLRFEYWKDKEGIVGEFKYLDVTAMTQGTVFENCSTFGLPANADTITTGNLKSHFDIKFKNCKLYGTWDAQGDTYSRASKSMLTFEECLKVPAINHVYGAEAVKSPIGVNYIRQNTQEGYPNSGTTVNRYYRGAVLGVGSHLAISKEPMIDTFAVREFVNTNTVTCTFPVWNVNPFTLQLAKIRLALHKNSLATPLTIKFFSDSIKTTEIANYTFNAPISQSVLIYSIVDILPASFTSTPVFSGGNSNIYMELSSTGNAGTCYVTCEFEYIHTGNT